MSKEDKAERTGQIITAVLLYAVLVRVIVEQIPIIYLRGARVIGILQRLLLIYLQ